MPIVVAHNVRRSMINASVVDRDAVELDQEARRLVAAEMQNVVYGEYLPTVLGVDYMQRHGLIVEEETRYDDTGPQ